VRYFYSKNCIISAEIWSPNIDLHEDYLDLLLLLMEKQLVSCYNCGVTKYENVIFDTVKQTSDIVAVIVGLIL